MADHLLAKRADRQVTAPRLRARFPNEEDRGARVARVSFGLLCRRREMGTAAVRFRQPACGGRTVGVYASQARQDQPVSRWDLGPISAGSRRFEVVGEPSSRASTTTAARLLPCWRSRY